MSPAGFRPHVIERHVDHPSTLLDFVSSELARTSRGPDLTVLELVEIGAVYVNDERSLNPARLLRTGDRVRIHASPRRFAVPSDLHDRLVSESGDWLVVEKPAGLPTEATVDNLRENLISALEDARRQSFFPVHSLESESTGLVLIAKSPEAQTRLKRAFAEGSLRRTYAVYVEATPLIDRMDGFRIAARESRQGETSVLTEGRTSWSIDPTITKYERLEIEATMLRPAELRETLARAGAVVIGDKKHGSSFTALENEKATPALKVISLTP